MDLDRWIERIYSERDVGRGVATSTSGATGLLTYLLSGDWVVSGFVAVIVFPIARIAASSFHSHWNQTRERTHSMDELRDLFDGLGSEEKAVVHAFVRHGGSVITWREFNRSQDFSHIGIESLINRGVASMGMMADGMTETFVLDTDLFAYAQKAFPQEPSK